jgi:predicted dehydrogenase
VLVVGAGDRGHTYADYVRSHPEAGRVVAVAEPDPRRREQFAARHGLEPRLVFPDWRAVLARGRIAQAALICTQDREHAQPAVAFARAGWDILLEKPMATTAEDCRAVVEAVAESGVLLGICHVLRYAPATVALKHLIEAGAIGEVVGAERLEPVGYWHFAHAYVRGHWRREEDSSPVLLAKCCHDLDWLRYVMGVPCVRVSSFASLHHFRPEARPARAGDRCLDCELEPECPYSAPALYLGELARGNRGWPVRVVALEPTVDAVREALREGPYGRCVYACDNDVPDHQVVSLEFAGSRLASFTMSAFTPQRNRITKVFGTHGWLVDDGERLEHHAFRSGRTEVVEVGRAGERHGGGDDRLMRGFLEAVARRNPSVLLSGPAEALESHLMVFAAEQARREGRVVELSTWLDGPAEAGYASASSR